MRLNRKQEPIDEGSATVRLTSGVPSAELTLSREAYQRGDFNAAVEAARVACTQQPMSAAPAFLLGCALRAVGNLDEARRELEHCTHIAPYYDPAYEALIDLLESIGDCPRALEVALRLEASVSGLADNRFRIGTLHLKAGEYQQAQQWFDRGLNSLAPPRVSRSLPFSKVTIPRLKHDCMQVRWLIERRKLDTRFDAVAASYERLLATLSDRHDCNEIITLEPDDLASISAFHRRCLLIHKCDRVENCLDRANDFATYEATFLKLPLEDRCIVIDDVLTPQALGALVAYCHESTIWHNDAQKGKNYLGAYQQSGFLPPLVVQIAETLKERMPRLLGGVPLSQVWAYRQVMGNEAIGTHADFAKVNVNLWVTPSEYNRVSESGGLRVYRAAAPDSWTFDNYNNDVEMIKSLTSEKECKTIEYRQNRAVIFDSRLFHESHKPQFVDTYEGMRINITILFGKRHD